MELPLCGDADTLEDVKGAIENSPLTKQITVKVQTIRQPQEVASMDNERSCTATVYMNSGMHVISYSLLWIDEEDMKAGNFMVNVTPFELF